MANEETRLTDFIEEIREVYYGYFPKGDYLSIEFTRETIDMNNDYSKDDREFPIKLSIVCPYKGDRDE